MAGTQCCGCGVGVAKECPLCWQADCLASLGIAQNVNPKVKIDHNVFLYYLLYGVKLRFD